MAKEKPKTPPIKQYYDVKVECLLPATLIYKVLAETPQQAADMIKNMQPTGVKHKLIGRKELKLVVYNIGSNIIKFIRIITK